MTSKEEKSEKPILLTRGEAARLLRMSERWLAQGNGPQETRFGRRVFYLQEDCMRYIRNQRKATAARKRRAG